MLLTKLLYSKGLDSDLFDLVKQDDVLAFEELYNRYWPALVNAAYKRLNSRVKAETIVQHIFVDIYQGRTMIDLTIPFETYLNKELKFKIFKEYQSGISSVKNHKYPFLNSVCKNDLAYPLE